MHDTFLINKALDERQLEDTANELLDKVIAISVIIRTGCFDDTIETKCLVSDKTLSDAIWLQIDLLQWTKELFNLADKKRCDLEE